MTLPLSVMSRQVNTLTSILVRVTHLNCLRISTRVHAEALVSYLLVRCPLISTLHRLSLTPLNPHLVGECTCVDV
ncbi:hypothetical protein ACTXT7_016540 [Hymenolepis weldensis]